MFLKTSFMASFDELAKSSRSTMIISDRGLVALKITEIPEGAEFKGDVYPRGGVIISGAGMAQDIATSRDTYDEVIRRIELPKS